MPRGKQKYPFRSDDYPKFDNYDGSSEKITALVEYFTKKWSWPDPVPRYAITRMAQRLKKCQPKEPFWTDRDENWLNEHLGLIPDAKICSHLKRTRVSIKLKAKRLDINKTMNLNTARSVALICGIPDSHTVMMWVRHGLLKAKRSPTHCGNNRMWNIDDVSLIKMLKSQPWLAYLPDMPDSYYKRLVEREWKRDPWFTREETAKMIGVGPEYVRRYVKRGWLQAVKVPGGRHSQVRWMFRASWVLSFLQNDPRKKYSQELLSLRRRAKHLLFDDDPIHLYAVWLIKCPRCGKVVAVSISRRRNWAAHVKKTFLNALNGTHECVHGEYLALEGTEALFKKKPQDQKRAGVLATASYVLSRQNTSP